MQVLAVDVGTGTQDIYLYDSDLDMENGYKMVAPSPTMMFHRRIRQATEGGRPVLLTGVLMGGGPISWAAADHVKAGYPLYATPAAARTFNDDLEAVQREMGVTVVSDDEAVRLDRGVLRLELKDFDYQMIAAAFEQFGYRLDPDVLAVAVFDHGDSPPGYSDRQFRFDYLRARIEARNSLSTFAFRAGEVPEDMTRLQAVVRSAAEVDRPVMVMDTAPAAVLGAILDPRVSAREQVLVANVGNFHCLVFRLGPGGIEGVFEHHTGEVTPARLDELVDALADATLTHEDVFHDHGHGALVYRDVPMSLPPGGWGIAVTGPRRTMMQDSRHRPYFAVPYGDMMMAGCFGMLCALPDIYPEYGEPILGSLSGAAGRPPWETG
jgi:uncharacterized protein (DUF1786 family)